MASTITTTDPRTGIERATDIEATSDPDVATIVAAAAAAFPGLHARPRQWRADMLRVLAEALDAHSADLVELAMSETGLAHGRLAGEVSRSSSQLRLFADAVLEGSYLEATIDHATETALGRGPDLRRMLIPLGPVAVFGSSNFPFAFSVPGGDTASALAAGCPVIVKAHGSHPLTSRLTFEVLRDAAASLGAPSGTLGIVYGQQAGVALVADPRVTAVGFTGSLGGAEALLAVIEKRENPIPFFGELSSVNPLVVTPGAAANRGSTIAADLFMSYTGSGGQLCTKPGVAFIPRFAVELLDALKTMTEQSDPQVLLNERIHHSFRDVCERLEREGGARTFASGHPGIRGFEAPAALLTVDVAGLTAAATEEAFGPLLLVVLYDDPTELVGALGAVPRSLTATIHSEDGEADLRRELTTAFVSRSGRIVYNGYPTGVRVAWGQQHGGPWPSTNSQHTSVGVSAMRRFLRPFAWQDAPADVLPAELREVPADIVRRIDGLLTVPACR